MKHLVLIFLALLAFSNPFAFGQGTLDLQPNDTVRSVLEHQVGKPVELRMKSGEKMGGKVVKVTSHLVHLAQLTEADFFDAAVEIESVAAVVVRVRSN